MNSPLVSVLVPVFRVEKYIERCARSVFEQTYQDLEYIFIDDATDDASIDILKEVLLDYPERQKKSYIISHVENKGLAAARNTAVKACRGELVFHVDSDDWVEKNAIELLVKKQKETNADIVSAEALDHDNDIATRHVTGGWDLDKNSLLLSILKYQVSTSLWRRLIRKSLYIDHDITCDERGSGGEDFQVFPRLVYYAKKVSGIEDYIYHYNKSNQQSISNNVAEDVAIQIQGLISVKVIVSFFSDKEPYLREIVAGMDIRNIHYRMINNVFNRNKKGYYVFLKYMKDSDQRYWSQIGWDSPWIRHLECCYYLIILVEKYRYLRDWFCRLRPRLI